MEDVYIIGTNGFAGEVTEYILDNERYKIKGYFDIVENYYKKYKYHAPFLASEENFTFASNDNVVIAISNSKIRSEIYCNLKKKVYFPNIIHKSAFISKSSQLDTGSIICPFATITANAKIGKNFQANIYSYVAHDCIIGDNVTFAPSVKCNGNVVIENNVYIGTGATIKNGSLDKQLTIGQNSTISAGAYVNKNVPPNYIAYGSPCKFIKKNEK
jgi:sugar O-acyltransferase (sialic acid O-acetyltransferase NeuD family)